MKYLVFFAYSSSNWEIGGPVDMHGVCSVGHSFSWHLVGCIATCHSAVIATLQNSCMDYFRTFFLACLGTLAPLHGMHITQP